MFKRTEIFGVGFFIVLFAALAFIGAREVSKVPENSELLEELRELTVRLCEEENAQDAEQMALWDFVLDSGDAAPRTHEEEAFRQAQLPKVRAFMEETFAPKDCSIHQTP